MSRIAAAIPLQAAGAAAADIRDALASLGNSVAVVACWDGDRPRGLLVNSLIGLSVAPPRLLFTLRKEAASHDALLRAAMCSVTVLGEEDRLEAERFSRSDRLPERFALSRWSLDRATPPAFQGGVVQFVVNPDQRIDADSHTIVTAGIQTSDIRQGSPLIYFQRNYRRLEREQIRTVRSVGR